MNFVKFYPRDKTLYIEINIDEYIKEQPVILSDVSELVKKYGSYIKLINKYTVENGLTDQIVIIDMDKAVCIQKMNLGLTAKLVYNLSDLIGPNENFKKIYVTHSNKFMLSLYTGFRPLIPTGIVKCIVFS
jgi:hypothetical protein